MPLLYERLRDYLLDEIRSGRLQPGDRVPSELELAAQFHVSRITSKKALETLRQDGIVTRSRGRGTFVARDEGRGTRDEERREDETGGNDPNAERRTPNAAHSSLVPRPSSPAQIGFIVPDIADIFGVRMLDAIEERCGELGYQLVLRRTRGSQQREDEAITAFVQAKLDGLIVFPVHGEYYNDALLRIVLDGYPVVLVDRYLKGIAVSAVHTDNYAASRALTAALIQRGHTRIAFVSPPPERTSSIEDRRRGFGAALREHGLPIDPGHYLMTLASTLPGTSFADGKSDDAERLRAFIDTHPEVTAYLACEYMLAQLLDREFAQIPAASRPTIACFDSPEDPFGDYRFLHVLQDERTIGRTAVDLLVAQITHPDSTKPLRHTIDFTIVEGEGSAKFQVPSSK